MMSAYVILTHINILAFLWILCVCLIQVDGSDMKRKGKNSGRFQVGKKKVKTKLSALAKAKAAQAMEIDK